MVSCGLIMGTLDVTTKEHGSTTYRLKAGGSPELRGTLSLDAIPERSFLYTDGGGGVGWGGVITSCEVRWMMLNPGRCCLVGRCCYVASFVVVYRRVGGVGWGGVITSCSTSEQNDQNKRNRTSNG